MKKIAVPYENGNVFQHFGHAEAFKVYETKDDDILSGEVIDTTGTGHEALAALLAGMGVNVVVCGGLGDGAMQALVDAGIEVCSGAKGEADLAVEAYLVGALTSQGTNCDHHHDEEGGGCGGHCGSCGGCHSAPLFEGPNVGKTCLVHYRGTLDDGTQFDSSYDRGEPLEFLCGYGMMIPGFDAAVATMELGQTITVHLEPAEAYGEVNPRNILTVEISQLPGSEDLSVGDRVALYDQSGRPIPVTVTAKDDANITFDANHELAGKALNFTIELVEIK